MFAVFGSFILVSIPQYKICSYLCPGLCSCLLLKCNVQEQSWFNYSCRSRSCKKLEVSVKPKCYVSKAQKKTEFVCMLQQYSCMEYYNLG
jgi:hypothetical protein